MPNPDGTLLPGMYVRAILNEGTRPAAILAPQQGVARDPRGGATALVVGSGNKVESRTVTLSREIGNQWLVDDGLQDGDRVIVEGVQKVRPGADAVPTEATTPAAR